MNDPRKLLQRLNEIGDVIAQSDGGLALIGLGSVGRETDRLDPYSDLDFFVIVTEDKKEAFLQDTGWLAQPAPITYIFRNTIDGHKCLYEDGIFCEMAVFTEKELETAAYAPGRIIWKAAHISESIAQPAVPNRTPPVRTTEWLLGEALSNLYVGLCRDHRGEKLTAQRFIQYFAVDRVLELASQLEQQQPAHKDPFMLDRRFEQLYPQTAVHLPSFIQGYTHNRASAQAILQFLDNHFTINFAIKHEIEQLISEG